MKNLNILNWETLCFRFASNARVIQSEARRVRRQSGFISMIYLNIEARTKGLRSGDEADRDQPGSSVTQANKSAR